MFIARTTLDTGQEFLVLGLSKENVHRLEKGQPIDISRKSHGMAIPASLRICIFVGEDEAAMRAQMAPLIDPTHTVIDQKEPQ